MRVLVGVITTNGKTIMEPKEFTPGEAVRHANMYVITAGERLLYVDAETGNHLNLAQVLAASLFGGGKSS